MWDVCVDLDLGQEYRRMAIDQDEIGDWLEEVHGRNGMLAITLHSIYICRLCGLAQASTRMGTGAHYKVVGDHTRPMDVSVCPDSRHCLRNVGNGKKRTNRIWALRRIGSKRIASWRK